MGRPGLASGRSAPISLSHNSPRSTPEHQRTCWNKSGHALHPPSCSTRHMGQPQAANDYLQFIQMIKPHMKHKRGVTRGLCVWVRLSSSSLTAVKQDKFQLENISNLRALPEESPHHYFNFYCFIIMLFFYIKFNNHI